MTFVKTKLLLERMAPGDTAEVRLKGAEPRDNVPRSVRDHGHDVLALDAEEMGGETYLLTIRKR
jgi:TusA-related sulfurtransferase